MRYIDADKIEYVPAVESGFYRNEKDKVSGEFTIAMFTSKDKIDSIPTADVKPVRHGHWETDRFGHGSAICSECKANWENDVKFYYCPRCGAKMDEEEKNKNG